MLKQPVSLGDVIVIEHEGQQHETEVNSITPIGSFGVHWYFGCNPLAPDLPGHYCCPFKADGSPANETILWRIIEHRPKEQSS